jgi:intracellular multiplication protein IcmE
MTTQMRADAPLTTSDDSHSGPIRDLAFTRSLLAIGVSITELKRLEFSASELKEAGCSAKDLLRAYSYVDIRNAGFGPLVLLDCGWSGDQFAGAGFTVHELINAGFGAEQLRRLGPSLLKGFFESDSQLDTKWLLDGGFSASELRQYSFDALKLKNAGCNAYQLKHAGFSAHELRQAGIDAAWLLAGGWKAAELASRVDDLAIFSASEMREAGVDAKSLAQLGYTFRDLRHAASVWGSCQTQG